MRWSPPTSSSRASSWKTVSDGEWPGRWCTRHVRPANASSPPSASSRVTVALAPHARNCADTALRAKRTSSGMPCRAMIASAKRSSSSIPSP